MRSLRGRTWAVLGVGLGVLAVALLFSFGLGHRGVVGASALERRPAPDFSLPGLDGHPGTGVRLSTLRGHVVVVNFWASWCAECRTEQAALNRTWEQFRDSGVVMVGVDFEDDPGDARQYVATSGGSYPVVVDKDSSTALAYGLRGVPETYVITPSGRLEHRVIGPVTHRDLASHIDALLARGTP